MVASKNLAPLQHYKNPNAHTVYLNGVSTWDPVEERAVRRDISVVRFPGVEGIKSMRIHGGAAQPVVLLPTKVAEQFTKLRMITPITAEEEKACVAVGLISPTVEVNNALMAWLAEDEEVDAPTPTPPPTRKTAQSTPASPPASAVVAEDRDTEAVAASGEDDDEDDEGESGDEDDAED